MTNKSIETMTISEAIGAKLHRGEVALHMEQIVMNSLDGITNKEKVAKRIVAVMYDMVGDPFNNPNIAFDLSELIDLVNVVSEDK